MKIKLTLILALLFMLFVIGYQIVQGKSYVPDPIATLAPPDIKRAMQKMGPRFEYRLWPSGRLEVKLNGKWLRLRY